jgi:hypothetical protein
MEEKLFVPLLLRKSWERSDDETEINSSQFRVLQLGASVSTPHPILCG